MQSEVTVAGELLSSLWIGVPIAVVLGLCEWLYHRRGLEGETTRKISHASAGLIVMTMPWVVSSHWTVLALSLSFGALLGGTRLIGLLPSIHAVSRRTGGALYYPMAVYLIYALSAGDPLLYCVPMLVMAFSDAGAAVVGRRYGIVRYRVIEDFRSLGGSVTFFGLTFALVTGGLGIAGYGDLPATLLITLLVAMISTAVEGISVRGADNILVPYVTFVVLDATLSLGREGLGSWVLGAALVLAILLASFRQTRLNATAFMALFVGGVLSWGLGGPVWFATLVVPYIAFAATRPPGGAVEADLVVIVPSFAVSLIIVLLFGHLDIATLFVPFTASVAAVAGIVMAGAVSEVSDRSAVSPLALLAATIGGVLTATPAVFMDTPVAMSVLALATAVTAAVIGPALLCYFDDTELSPALGWVASVLGGTSTSLIWVLV